MQLNSMADIRVNDDMIHWSGSRRIDEAVEPLMRRSKRVMVLAVANGTPCSALILVFAAAWCRDGMHSRITYLVSFTCIHRHHPFFMYIEHYKVPHGRRRQRCICATTGRGLEIAQSSSKRQSDNLYASYQTSPLQTFLDVPNMAAYSERVDDGFTADAAKHACAFDLVICKDNL